MSGYPQRADVASSIQLSRKAVATNVATFRGLEGGKVRRLGAVLKGNAKKVRRIFGGQVLVGFAGATADAFTLLERFETKLNQFNGDVKRSSVELAKDWRTDKILRKLEAMMLVDSDAWQLFDPDSKAKLRQSTLELFAALRRCMGA